MASNVIDDSDLSSENECEIDDRDCDNSHKQNKIDNADINDENVESVLESFGLPELVASFKSNSLFFFCFRKTV